MNKLSSGLLPCCIWNLPLSLFRFHNFRQKPSKSLAPPLPGRLIDRFPLTLLGNVEPLAFSCLISPLCLPEKCGGSENDQTDFYEPCTKP